jgi:hypothetical protein
MTAPVGVKPTPLNAYVIDPLERAGSTFVQQFAVLLIPLLAAIQGSHTLTISGNSWLMIADMSGFAAVISLVTSAATFAVPKLGVGWDLLLRVFKTFAQSFLGVISTAQFVPSVLHADWQYALSVAIPVSLTALIKGLASMAAPWSDGASLIPMHVGLYAHAITPVDQSVALAAVDAADTNAGVTEGDLQFATLDSAKASSPEGPKHAAPNLRG